VSVQAESIARSHGFFLHPLVASPTGSNYLELPMHNSHSPLVQTTTFLLHLQPTHEACFESLDE
jgi:hypothetical protein